MPGTIFVKPVQANLTHNTSRVIGMDPYCQMIVGKKKKKSDICYNGGKNPHWEEMLSLKVGDEPKCFLEIKDKTMLLPDSNVGLVELDLQEVESQGKISKWLPIKHNDEPAGEILVEAYFEAAQIGSTKETDISQHSDVEEPDEDQIESSPSLQDNLIQNKDSDDQRDNLKNESKEIGSLNQDKVPQGQPPADKTQLLQKEILDTSDTIHLMKQEGLEILNQHQPVDEPTSTKKLDPNDHLLNTREINELSGTDKPNIQPSDINFDNSDIKVQDVEDSGVVEVDNTHKMMKQQGLEILSESHKDLSSKLPTHSGEAGNQKLPQDITEVYVEGMRDNLLPVIQGATNQPDMTESQHKETGFEHEKLPEHLDPLDTLENKDYGGNLSLPIKSGDLETNKNAFEDHYQVNTESSLENIFPSTQHVTDQQITEGLQDKKIYLEKVNLPGRINPTNDMKDTEGQDQPNSTDLMGPKDPDVPTQLSTQGYEDKPTLPNEDAHQDQLEIKDSDIVLPTEPKDTIESTYSTQELSKQINEIVNQSDNALHENKLGGTQEDKVVATGQMWGINDIDVFNTAVTDAEGLEIAKSVNQP